MTHDDDEEVIANITAATHAYLKRGKRNDRRSKLRNRKLGGGVETLTEQPNAAGSYESLHPTTAEKDRMLELALCDSVYEYNFLNMANQVFTVFTEEEEKKTDEKDKAVKLDLCLVQLFEKQDDTEEQPAAVVEQRDEKMKRNDTRLGKETRARIIKNQWPKKGIQYLKSGAKMITATWWRELFVRYDWPESTCE